MPLKNRPCHPPTFRALPRSPLGDPSRCKGCATHVHRAAPGLWAPAEGNREPRSLDAISRDVVLGRRRQRKRPVLAKQKTLTQTCESMSPTRVRSAIRRALTLPIGEGLFIKPRCFEQPWSSKPIERMGLVTYSIYDANRRLKWRVCGERALDFDKALLCTTHLFASD